MRAAILKLYAWLIGYRFSEELSKPLKLPKIYEKYPDNSTIRAKATASLTSAGVFLGLSIGVLVAITASEKLLEKVHPALEANWGTSAFVVCLLYLVVRQERVLSRVEKRKRDYPLLFILLTIALVTLLLWPYVCSFKNQQLFSQQLSPSQFQSALLVASLGTIVVSILFQVFAVELYDSAAGWRGCDDEPGRVLRFHLASLASHSFLIGMGLAILGVAMFLAYINFWVGSIITFVSLCVIVGLTEIERELWNRRKM